MKLTVTSEPNGFEVSIEVADDTEHDEAVSRLESWLDWVKEQVSSLVPED